MRAQMTREPTRSVWDRTERDSVGEQISPGLYNFIIGAVLAWGFLVNYIMVGLVSVSAFATVHPFLFFIGYFVCCMIGVAIYTKSDSPWVSFLGYNLVVVPFGFVINLVVSMYDPSVVLDAVRVTGFVTLGMMFLGSMFPMFFRRIAGALTLALIIVIIVEVVEIFIFKMHHDILDWVVAAIFCGYIGVDWGRANSIPKTADNAVDSAAALYMDIINLFVRILAIMGRSRGSR